MRILFVTTPLSTIFYPMVPLAWALRTAGHDVRVASYPNFADTITQAGLTAVPVGRDRNMLQLLPGQTEELLEEARRGLPRPYDIAEDPEGTDWEEALEGYYEALYSWHRLENFPLVAGLVEFARQWKPDLVLWEPMAFAGAIAAKACGAAHGRLLWTMDVFGVARERFLELREQQPEGERVDPLGEWLEGYARKYGFEFSEDLVTGQFTVDQFPRAWGMRARELEYVPMRYVPYGGPAVVPRWLRERPERSRVAVSMGVAAISQFSGYPVDLREVLEGVADLDVEVVATVPEAEQEKMAPLPDNVRMVPYVPLADLAATCDAVVNHAGLGTMMAMGLYGVPQVALPWDFEAPELARRAAEYGSTLALSPEKADAATVREAVRRVLDEPSFRERAADLREQIISSKSPTEAVSDLEAFTERHRSDR